MEERAITIKFEEETKLKILEIEQKAEEEYIKGLNALKTLEAENLDKENALIDDFTARIDFLNKKIEFGLETIKTKETDISDLQEQLRKYYITY